MGEQPEEEHFTERLAVYVTPSLRDRLTQARTAVGLSQPDWIRRALDVAASRHEAGGGTGEAARESGPISGADPVVALAAANAKIEGMEAIVEMQRERIGMSDAQNIELNRRLGEVNAMANRLTLALPAPGETSEGRGFRWRFWER